MKTNKQLINEAAIKRSKMTMDEYISRNVNLYIQGYITKNELAEMVAKEYAHRWSCGRILTTLGIS